MENFDVLIVGSGLAGLSAGLSLNQNLRVAIATEPPRITEESSTAWAQGGVASFQESPDSLDAHIHDTLEAGAQLNNIAAVRAILEMGPAAIDQLRTWGMNFETHFRKEGGHSTARVLHAGDQSGLRMVQSLWKTLKSTRSDIQVLTGLKAHKLNLDQSGKVQGCIFTDPSGKSLAIRASKTVLCTGGLSSLYAKTTNPRGAQGDGLKLALKAGAVLSNMEFVQFHPTVFFKPNGQSLLLTEALRGEGARIVDKQGRRLLDGLELQTRDKVSKFLFQKEAYLDLRPISKQIWPHDFQKIDATLRECGFDPEQDLIPISPAAHYHCGGVLTSVSGQTTVEGLFALGETACTGLHGANRLASNSLLECVVMGMSFAQMGVDSEVALKPPAEVDAMEPLAQEEGPITNLSRQVMWDCVGIVRNHVSLSQALEQYSSQGRAVEHCVAYSAWKRTQSLGCHFRSDSEANTSEQPAPSFIQMLP